MNNDNIVQENLKSNKYDFLLIFYIVLLVFGTLGDALQPIRIVALILMPYIFHVILTSYEFRKSNSYVLFLFAFWFAYAVISLIWAMDTIDGLKELSYLLVNFTSFLIIVFLANKSVNPKKSIMIGWIIIFLLTIPIALFELSTDIHLSSSVHESDYTMNLDSVIFERKFASVTFGNLNSYNTILMYVLPMILGFILCSSSKKQLAIIWAILFMYLFILVSNGSRGAILSASIGLMIFIYYFLKNNRSKFSLFLILLIAIFLFANYFSAIFNLIIERFISQGLSDVGRVEIILASFDALTKSYFFGVGAGNFQAILSIGYNLDIVAAHNFFLEVGIQYGIVIFILFMYLFVIMYKRQKLSNEIYVRNIVFGSLCMVPLTFTIDSGYILGASVWVFLSSLYVISNPDLDKNRINYD